LTPLLLLCFFFSYYGDPRYLHSFPTRRSSDLIVAIVCTTSLRWNARRATTFSTPCSTSWSSGAGQAHTSPPSLTARRVRNSRVRSEEHTSELQSLRHLVCRLLLEKKKHPRRKH